MSDAACKKCHAGTASPNRRECFAKLRKEEGVIDAGKQLFALSQAQKFKEASSPGKRLQPGALVEAKKLCRGSDAIGVGKQLAKNEIASEAGGEGALVVTFDASAGVFDEFSVLDAGGASSFTGTAVEAFVDVIDEGIGDGSRGVSLASEFVLGYGDHLLNAAARRVGFQIPEAVGGAGVEAKAAVDTTGIVFVDGNLTEDR